VWINKEFVGVEKENINKYYILVFIQLIGTVIPMLYIFCMIPSNEEINKVQQMNSLRTDNKQEDLEEETPQGGELEKG